MSASIAERIRRAREGKVEVNGKTFLYHRPTDIQMAGLNKEFGGEISRPEIARRFVFGWSGFMESDLFPGGDEAEVVKFDAATFDEWLNDARDYWAPLYEAILGAYVEYSSAREDEEKK